jgi:hypothetical protein
MQVTQEDGGKLNAFAREPRMVVMEEGERGGQGSRALLIGGAVLVAVLIAVKRICDLLPLRCPCQIFLQAQLVHLLFQFQCLNARHLWLIALRKFFAHILESEKCIFL